MSVDPALVQIDLARDAEFNDFTLQTLKERYLLPGEVSPQHAFARAAAAFADDPAHAQRLYDYVSRLWFMFATPLLSNGGSERGLPISCFLNATEDSRQGIFDHWAETGWLSSVGGGVGGYWGDLRSAGEKTGRGSSSTGVIPFIAVVDRLILSVSQGGTRRGSYAAYLDIYHPEIEEFITMRKPTGGDQNRKATNLHNAVNVTDEFMEAVRNNGEFHLRSPRDGSIRKTVRARDLWRLLLETRMQTGEPYMVFIDTINRALPEAQKRLGLKVKQSNLCVAPYTNILTRKGYIPIAALEDKEVEAWNGQEFTSVTIRRTAEQASLVRVNFWDGDYIDCTPDHNFYTEGLGKLRAIELNPGDMLAESFPLPIIGHNFKLGATVKDSEGLAFTAGWATFAGIEDRNRLTVSLPLGAPASTKLKLLQHSRDSELHETNFMIRYEPRSIPSGYVPFHWCYSDRAEWILGAFASVGENVDNPTYPGYRAIISTDEDMIREARLLALSIGLNPIIRLSQTTAVLMLSNKDLEVIGTGAREPASRELVKVTSVHPLPYKTATFCATETKKGKLTFNGYVTGNCTEITLPTGVDRDGKNRTAVCCLSSVNAEKYDEWKDDPLFLEDLFRMLDNALQDFITKAPDDLENARYSAGRERSVGLGLLGFQAYLQKHGFSMEGTEAELANLMMFKYLKTEANRVSKKLGSERGEAPDMAGTGERFAHKLAIAPNASSSILCGGTSPSIEPHRANAYLHKTLSGSFPVKNPHLVNALKALDLDTEETWRSIIGNEGSVQHLDIPQDVKDVFKTATEIDQMVLVALAADRAGLICQAQSLNLFFEAGTDAGTLTRVHFAAWERGVKSLYYCRSTTPKRAENTNNKVERITMTEAKAVEDSSCLSCEG